MGRLRSTGTIAFSVVGGAGQIVDNEIQDHGAKDESES